MFKNPKLAKQALKILAMGAGSLLIGTIIKGEKRFTAWVDERYDETESESQDN